MLPPRANRPEQHTQPPVPSKPAVCIGSQRTAMLKPAPLHRRAPGQRHHPQRRGLAGWFQRFGRLLAATGSTRTLHTPQLSCPPFGLLFAANPPHSFLVQKSVCQQHARPSPDRQPETQITVASSTSQRWRRFVRPPPTRDQHPGFCAG